MPEVYWFRDRHQWSDGRVTISGSAAFSQPLPKDQLRILIGGQPAELAFTEVSEQFRNAFWFLPPAHLTGFTATVDRVAEPMADPAEHPGNFLDVTLDFDGVKLPEWLRTFQISPHFKKLRPTPDNFNIERVSGKGATSYNYWNNGRTDFRRFSAIAQAHGLDVANPQARILDWGCGCARLTRYFRALPEGGRWILGIDIDPVNIAWCREHIADDGFAVCPLVPPAGAEGPFDLIVGNSVITHLKQDVMEMWLDELAGLLAPDGLVLLSYHGDFSAATICSRHLEFWERIRKTGFDASLSAGELNDAIADPDYYRQTFMTDRFARSLFRRRFTVEKIYVGLVSRYQNVAVLKKRRE